MVAGHEFALIVVVAWRIAWPTLAPVTIGKQMAVPLVTVFGPELHVGIVDGTDDRKRCRCLCCSLCCGLCCSLCYGCRPLVNTGITLWGRPMFPFGQHRCFPLVSTDTALTRLGIWLHLWQVVAPGIEEGIAVYSQVRRALAVE